MMKKKVLCWLTYITLGIYLSGCANGKHESQEYTQKLYTPLYSANFSINGNEETGNILIKVMNPWQGAENVSQEFLIVSDSLHHNDYYKGPYIKKEAKRIICMSSTHIAMLEALGTADRIVGVSGKEYISSSEIRNNPNIPDIGYEGNIDYETLVATNPDLVLLFSVNGASAMEQKLKELKIPFLYIGDYVEEDPLGKSEWIVPVAEVVGKRESGIQKFKEIAQRYESLKNTVKQSELSKPSVMVNAPFLDSWFMPSTQSYVAKMIEDAGGIYIYDKNTGNTSKPIELEEALKYVDEADFWINIGTVSSLDELKATFPKFVSADCVKNRNVFNNNQRSSPGGGNDCYESGVMHPDVVLRDMVKIFHPELVDEEFFYYRRLK